MRNPFPIGIKAQAAPAIDAFDARLERIAGPLRGLDEAAVRAQFELDPVARVFKTTISLCPECLGHVPAVVYAQAGAALLAKRCETHGLSRAVLENDERYYQLSNKDRWGRCYAPDRVIAIPAFEGEGCCASGDCGSAPDTSGWRHDLSDQRSNKSCTVLVEVTNACNLACHVCYSDSKGDRLLPFAQFCAAILGLIAAKGHLDSVQITGGEASLHPQFVEMIAFLYAQTAVSKIYLPTNGIEFAKDGFAERLVPYRRKLLVLLQFDGAFAETNRALRAARPQRVRAKVIDRLKRLDIPMQLTMTLARGISEREIAWVVKQGVRHRNVRLVALLPATFSGRHELSVDPMHRLTLSDVVKGVVAGLGVRSRESDFAAIPCSHPNCGWATLFARRFGLLVNIGRYVDLDAVVDRVAYKTQLGKREVQSIVGSRHAGLLTAIAAKLGRRLIRPQDVFGVVSKPFMDRYNYDQDRISSCCHHMLDTHGRLESFCEYNARHRVSDVWDRFPNSDSLRTKAEVAVAG